MEHILTAKATDLNADVSATEAEIDRRVYELYGLTATEISAVEETAFTIDNQRDIAHKTMFLRYLEFDCLRICLLPLTAAISFSSR